MITSAAPTNAAEVNQTTFSAQLALKGAGTTGVMYAEIGKHWKAEGLVPRSAGMSALLVILAGVNVATLLT